MQRLESGIRLVVEYIEAVNLHKLDSILGLLSPECAFEPAFGTSPRATIIGQEEIRAYFERLFSQRSDIHFSTEELIGFGHRCLMRWKCTWTDGRGETQSLRGADIVREKNDLICEILSYGKTEG